MKKCLQRLFALSLCVSSAAYAFAAPWGALQDYNRTPQGHVTTDRVGENYLLKRVLAGQPLRVTLSFKKPFSEKKKVYAQKIEQAYNQWFSYPARLIRQSGREEEFADILPLLDKGIQVEFGDDSTQADIAISVLPFALMRRICGPSSYGCYKRPENSAPQIIITEDKWLSKVLSFGQGGAKYLFLHETGHSLGLSDQYEQARSSTSHTIYSTEDNRSAVMNRSLHLTCDDADGMINLIDLTRGSSRGGDFGWRSLCKKSDVYYVHGAPADKSPYALTLLDNSRLWKIERYKGGQLISQEILPLALDDSMSPFQPITGTVTEKDKTGRPLRMQGSQGEDIYYAYVYDQYTRLVTKNGKVLLAEIKTVRYPNLQKGKKENVFIRSFGEDGHVSAIEYRRPVRGRGKAGVAIYQKGLEQDKLLLHIYLEFDRQGRIIDQFVNFKDAAKTGSNNVLAQQMQRQILQNKMQELAAGYLRRF